MSQTPSPVTFDVPYFSPAKPAAAKPPLLSQTTTPSASPHNNASIRPPMPPLTTTSTTSINVLTRTDLIKIIVPILNSFTSQEPDGIANRTIFHGTCVPGIAMQDYVTRMIEYGKITHSTVLIAIIYLDRLLVNNTVSITTWTAHRIFLAAVVLASKYHNDDYYNNGHMSAVGGVQLRELNAMELSLVSSLNFSLWVSPQMFSKYEALLILSSASEKTDAVETVGKEKRVCG